MEFMPVTNSYLQMFDDSLWKSSFAKGRSREMSPLYIDRYRGPRAGADLTAHDFWELTATTAGTGKLIGTPEVPLKPGTLCLVPPGLLHNERSGPDMDTIWIGFHARRLPAFRTQIAVQNMPLVLFIEQLWIFSKQRGGPIGPELDARTSVALSWFLRLHSEGAPAMGDDLMDQAVKYMDQHFAQKMIIMEIARKLHCSEGHLHRAFKRHTGRTPIEYLSRLRIQHASHLLKNTDLPVNDIAKHVGYPDPFYFSRVFRKFLEQSPSEFRERARGHKTSG